MSNATETEIFEQTRNSLQSLGREDLELYSAAITVALGLMMGALVGKDGKATVMMPRVGPEELHQRIGKVSKRVQLETEKRLASLAKRKAEEN